jgi:hypothetical protein
MDWNTLLIGMIIGMTIHPPVMHIYRYAKWLWHMRQVGLQLTGESRKNAKERAGEWRDD